MTARRLTARRNVLDNRKDEVIAYIVAGASYSQTAQQFGVAKSSITSFIGRWEDELRALQAKAAHAAEDYAIASKVNRIAALDDRWQRVRRVIDQRAADGAKNWAGVPGMDTGIVVHQVKQIGAGKNATIIDEFVVDTGTMAEARAIEKAAADELGQIPRPDVHNTVNVGILVRQLAGFNPEDIG
jgi:transposase-like protein